MFRQKCECNCEKKIEDLEKHLREWRMNEAIIDHLFWRLRESKIPLPVEWLTEVVRQINSLQVKP